MMTSSKNIRIRGYTKVDVKLRSNQILWRYLDLGKFIDFVMFGRLYFSRSDQLADKFEGAFTKTLYNSIKASYQQNDIDFTPEEFKKHLKERVFVNCWHRGPDDSMAMWAIYGGKNPSIAITTTVGQLKTAITDAKIQHYSSIQKVTYIKHWKDPKINHTPYSNILAHKVNAYEYEREVRVIIDKLDDDIKLKESKKGMYVNISRNQLLRSIVISPEAPQWFRELVKQLLVDYKLSTIVKKSRLESTPI